MQYDDAQIPESPHQKVQIAEAYADPLITQAQNQIYQTFGDVVSVTNKAKTLYKFGRNPAVGTSLVTIDRTGADETYATDNTIAYFSSSNAGDTQEITVEGHTISGGVLTFKSQTVTLAGQTKTALETPLARCSRVANNNNTDFAGDIYVYEDDTVTSGVPQTASKIHMKVTEGNQSEKCSTSISNNDYYIITSFHGYCFDKSAATVEYIGEMREVGTTNKVFRRVFSTAGANGKPTTQYFNPPFIVPKNYDVRVRAVADGTNTDVGAAFNGYLASVES